MLALLGWHLHEHNSPVPFSLLLFETFSTAITTILEEVGRKNTDLPSP